MRKLRVRRFDHEQHGRIMVQVKKTASSTTALRTPSSMLKSSPTRSYPTHTWTGVMIWCRHLRVWPRCGSSCAHWPTVHYHWPGDVWVRLPCIKVLTVLHTQRHSLPECKPEIWQPIFSQGTGHMCNRPLGVCPGHNQGNNLSEMYHYHYFLPFLSKSLLCDTQIFQRTCSANVVVRL